MTSIAARFFRRLSIDAGSQPGAAELIVCRALQILIFVVAIWTYVPFSPSMPGENLDPSWQFGLNQALAQGLVFGRDLIFTLGPYASIYTKVFHPGTDALMMGGALYLGLSLGAVLTLATWRSRWYWSLAALLLLTLMYAYMRDTLLFFYAATVGVYCYGRLMSDATPSNRYGDIVLFGLLIFPFGLLVLIKGSVLVLCVAMAALICALSGYRRGWQAGVALALLVPISVAFFWLLAGQPLSVLPAYLDWTVEIISGYSEAMAANSLKREGISYLLVSFAVLWIAWREDRSPVQIRVFGMLLFFVPLFLAFKGGFTRHDGHAVLSGQMLMGSALLLNLLFSSARTVAMLCLSFFVWLHIDGHYLNTRPQTIWNNFSTGFTDAWRGIELRSTDYDQLARDYENTLAKIHGKANFRKLPGTTDIYSYNQAYLLAAGNRWNPRPIFQSYSAYTSRAIERNKQHLLGEHAPDNVIFKVEPLDDRMPSMEDGASWPVLLSNYRPTAFENGFLYLQRGAAVQSSVARSQIAAATHLFGESVSVPDGAGGAIYVEIAIEFSMLGKFMNVIYKPSELEIELTLMDGRTKTYRLISGMIKTGLLLSPLVADTSDFASLYAGADALADKRVRSLTIAPRDRKAFWNREYRVAFFDLQLPQRTKASRLDEFDVLVAREAARASR